ncbi:hypothetical protein AAF712_010887 [Marasmius tenuissimus]|uniref:Uncharacterized protein n=1 Tax=Marasmius tenuissimus TaxID=585030 RepID=A0ABR2ZM59_9AGAR
MRPTADKRIDRPSDFVTRLMEAKPEEGKALFSSNKRNALAGPSQTIDSMLPSKKPCPFLTGLEKRRGYRNPSQKTTNLGAPFIQKPVEPGIAGIPQVKKEDNPVQLEQPGSPRMLLNSGQPTPVHCSPSELRDPALEPDVQIPGVPNIERNSTSDPDNSDSDNPDAMYAMAIEGWARLVKGGDFLLEAVNDAITDAVKDVVQDAVGDAVSNTGSDDEEGQDLFTNETNGTEFSAEDQDLLMDNVSNTDSDCDDILTNPFGTPEVEDGSPDLSDQDMGTSDGDASEASASGTVAQDGGNIEDDSDDERSLDSCESRDSMTPWVIPRSVVATLVPPVSDEGKLYITSVFMTDVYEYLWNMEPTALIRYLDINYAQKFPCENLKWTRLHVPNENMRLRHWENLRQAVYAIGMAEYGTQSFANTLFLDPISKPFTLEEYKSARCTRINTVGVDVGPIGFMSAGDAEKIVKKACPPGLLPFIHKAASDPTFRWYLKFWERDLVLDVAPELLASTLLYETTVSAAEDKMEVPFIRQPLAAEDCTDILALSEKFSDAQVAILRQYLPEVVKQRDDSRSDPHGVKFWQFFDLFLGL